jgi:hypothetical protein
MAKWPACLCGDGRWAILFAGRGMTVLSTPVYYVPLVYRKRIHIPTTAV